MNTEPNLNEFLNTILQAALNNIPKTRPPRNQKHAPWWNNDCQRLVALRRRALKEFEKCICHRHFEKARDAKAQAKKKIILNAKKESWESFSNQFNRFTPL